MVKQLQLFDGLDEPRKAEGVERKSRDVVFNDYESFVRKFTESPKTTDDCYTPRDVYEAVLRYVGEIKGEGRARRGEQEGGEPATAGGATAMCHRGKQGGEVKIFPKIIA